MPILKNSLRLERQYGVLAEYRKRKPEMRRLARRLTENLLGLSQIDR